jgi:hypothetical protein
MAGDWIKMRVSLVTHPKVMAIAEYLADQGEFQEWSTLSGFVPCYGSGNEKTLRNERYSALRVTRYVTVCALLRFWGYANEHCRDEFITFMSIEDIDEVVQIPCFGSALESVGWVVAEEEGPGIALPNFNEFNAAAIDRAGSAERQKRYRERKKLLKSDASLSDVTRGVTRNAREEKRREEKKDITPSAEGFARFWKSWPASDRKVGKSKCVEKWVKAGFETDAAAIVAHVELMKATNKSWSTGYEPAPLTYLNQTRWKDSEGGDGNWWEEAGFSKEWQATNAGCTATNACQWRNGERIGEQV